MRLAAVKGFHLSIQQARLWSVQHGSQAFRSFYQVSIEGQLDVAAFQQALQKVVVRHSILRSQAYTLPGMDMPMQVVSDAVETVCTFVSLENVDAFRQEDVLAEYTRYIQEVPFDVTQGPLFQCFLLSRSMQEHILLLSLSAFCADAASLKLVIHELARFYTASLEEEEEPLQYSDFASWQEELLAEEDAEEQRNFWCRIDPSLLTTMPIPFARDGWRKSLAESQDAFAPYAVDILEMSTSFPQLQALLQRTGCSLEAFLLACWQVLIWRFTAQTPLLIGVESDGRIYEELTTAIGPYSQSLPLSLSLTEQSSFERVLVLVQNFLNEAKQRQIYFDWQSCFAIENASSQGKSGFPISFAYEDWPVKIQANGLNFHLTSSMSCIEPFALKLHALLVGQQLKLKLYFDPRVLSAVHMRSLAKSFSTLLYAAIAHAELIVSAYPLLSEDDQHTLHHLLSTPSKPLPFQTLIQAFEARAEQYAQDIAVVCGAEKLTYEQLNRQANRVAHVLQRHSVGSQTLVGLFVDRSVHMLVGILAILKAGGAYVPLDPDLPASRLNYLLNDLQLTNVLTLSHVLPRLPVGEWSAWCLDELNSWSDAECIDNPHPQSTDDDLAYVIYTSGSTGLPKGVMIRQQSMVNYAFALCEILAVQPGWHFATVSTLAADLGNTAIFCSLVSGGCLHILTYETVTSGALFADYVSQYPVDVLKIVPSHLSALLNSCMERQILPRKHLVLGGEALSYTLLQQLECQRGNCCVLNHYGPTEATIGAIVNVLGELGRGQLLSVRSDAVTVPIGRPITGTEAYVLDRFGHLLPSGITGELYLGGVGLAAGYWQRPEQTQERFIAHPWRKGVRARLYRTGDLVRYQEDGTVEFVGRTDAQVKLRGYRIEPGELEAILGQHPAVRQNVVILREDTPDDKRLVAYIVARQQELLTEEALREFLHERVPAYMLPSSYVFLRALPLNSNGKVDRGKLPQPDAGQKQKASDMQLPRTPVEEIVSGIWKSVLRVKQLGIHDQFTSLGGHSLLATQVISRIRQALQVDVPLRALFETPTVAGLSQTIEQLLNQAQALTIPTLQPLPRSDELPLSFAQQRLWFLYQLEPESTAYLLPRILRLSGPLNAVALERSFAELVQRHEVLRTIFVEQAGQPIQVIQPGGDFRLPVIDMRRIDRELREQELQRLIVQEAQSPCDLARGPLLRIALLRLDTAEHVLFLTMHHIITDAWSNDVLLRELIQLYRAFASGQPSPLKPLPLQYADYAIWQRQWLDGEMLDAQTRYWKQQLADIPPLELPTDHPRPAVQTFHGAFQFLHLPASLQEQLVALSQQEGVTLFMTLMAAFQVLLARYSGQKDIAVGIAIANRLRPELEELIGFFVNTLVLRTDLSENPSFVEILKRVRKVALEAYTHQDVPFEKLVEVVQPERDPSRPPLFQVALHLRQVTDADTRGIEQIEDLRFETLNTENTTTKFDMTLNIMSYPHGLGCGFEYNTDLFDASMIQQMLISWQNLLEGIVAAPETSLADLPLLTPAQSQQLLAEWSGQSHDPVEIASLPTLFEAQVQRTPDAIALVSDQGCLSYAHLERRANQLAHLLRQRGVGPEVLVAVIGTRSVELLISLLAISKAGGGYVPLDPASPSERLAYQLTDAGVSLLLSVHPWSWQTSTVSVESLALSQLWSQLETAASEPPSLPRDAENVAYVIYTSGSTGQPKGVAVSHWGLGNLVRGQVTAFGIGPQSRVLQFASPSFDASIAEMLVSLLAGASLHLAEPEQLQPGQPLLRLLEERAITVVTLPPSVLRVLPEGGMPGVETLVVAGEACGEDEVEGWSEGRRMCNAYGPTETTVCASIAEGLQAEGRAPSIGRALSQTQLFVLDGQQRLVPPGVPGELYIGGPGLAIGYVGKAELTAERFVPHVWSEQPGERLYRTGDRVKYGEDGRLHYLGRIDRQVKLRGYRIELGEIEAVLKRHPYIQDAAVLIRAGSGAQGDLQLVAYGVTHASSVEIQEEELVRELRDFMSQFLPNYMLPAAIVLLEWMPLTASGKVDYKALSLQSASDSETRLSIPGVHTPFEELITEIWCDVLGDDEVDIHDNFFDLGGHSLLATQIIARMQAALGVELPLQTIFEVPTIAGLALRAEQALRGQQEQQMPMLVPVPRSQDLPLSFAQQRLWLLDQLEPGNTAYLILAAHRIHGALHTRALECSIGALIERHESLRTTFALRNENPVQVIHQPGQFSLPLIDLQDLSPAEREHAAQRLADQEAQQPCDLVSEPLLRAFLIRQDFEEHVFLLTMHHIISDGLSQEVFVNELTTLYRSFVAGLPSPLPPLPIQYADFAVWQRSWLKGEVLEAQRAYWKQRLTATQPLELPTDHPRPPIQTYNGARQFLHLPSGLLEQLRALCHQADVTLFMLLIAAFSVLLARYSGQTDISIGTPITRRSRTELEGLIGFFVNTLVLRTDLSHDPTFMDVLAHVREVALGAYAHQDVPFEQLVEVLQPERDLSRSPLFQVMFILQMALETIERPEGLHMEALRAEYVTTKFDLTLSVICGERDLSCRVEYNRDLFEEETMRGLLERWQRLLHGIARAPQTRISALPLLSASEIQQQLLDWNATDAPLPQGAEASLARRFEQQVQQTPERVALVFEDSLVTYAHLNRRANQLAHLLRSLGVGPEVVVGIALPRGLWLHIALLAVLKAGGAYLPLDLSYPAERLRFMLQNSQASILLTGSLQDPEVAALTESLPPLECQVLSLPAIWSQLASAPLDNLPGEPLPDSLAYVIYTSGSTGQPKGAMNTQRGIANRLTWMQRVYGLNAQDRVLQKTPISFDVSVWELFWPLVEGAQLVLARPEGQRDPAYLIELIEQQQVTLLHFVPSLLQVFLQEEGVERCQSLRQVICSGEVLSGGLYTSFVQRLRQCRLDNLYGPTEAAVDVSRWSCAVEEVESVGSVPIGRPIENLRLYVLDGQGRLVPPGVPGELYIGGIGVGRGYVGRGDLTAERFVPNPFVEQEQLRGEGAGAWLRLYRTGDRVRYDRRGVLEYVGRMDEQVKLRGQRIELREIEQVMQGYEQVKDSVVVLREDGGGGKHLVGYVVTGEREPLEEGELRQYLQERLPGYMVPTWLLQVEAWPLLPNGKLDRRGLPEPQRATGADREVVAPRTPLEEILASIWAQVLGVQQIGIHDNFFSLGGDSILGIQVVNRARRAGLHFTPRQIFQYQTIAQLINVIDMDRVTAAEQKLVTGPVELTPIQHWFFQQELSNRHHFNQDRILEIRERQQPSHLLHAIWHLLCHHDALRLRFVEEDNHWLQYNAGLSSDVPFIYVDLAQLSDQQQRKAMETLAAAAQTSLDLQTGSLLRALFFDRGVQESGYLLLIIHHLAIDGVSWSILLEDLESTLDQLRRKETVALPTKTTSFQRWAQELQRYASSEMLQQELTYWLAPQRRQVAPLPLDVPTGSNSLASAVALSVTLDAQQTRKLLQEVPAVYHTQINEVLLTALARAFADWTHQHLLLVDLEGHGREEILDGVDLSRTVGWFTTFFPVLLDTGQATSIRETLKAIKEQVRQVPQRGIGYGLLKYLHPDPQVRASLMTLPQAQVSFNYLGQLDQPFGESSQMQRLHISAGSAQGTVGQRPHTLIVNGSVVGGCLTFVWQYSHQLHRVETIQRLAHAFLRALQEIIVHCQSPEAGGYTPSDFPLAGLQQSQLEQIERQVRLLQTAGGERFAQQIEDIYPLTPMQEGLLFHSLYAPEAGAYHEQFSWKIQGALDIIAWQKAWQQVVNRHPILRTLFVWKELKQSLQVVLRSVKIPWSYYDWSDLTAEEQRKRLENLHEEDLRRGLDLEKVPLLRLTLVRLGEQHYHALLSLHHLLLDGWSQSLVFKEVLTHYQAYVQETEPVLSSPRSYRDYIAWLQQQDMDQAKQFWLAYLSGFHAPTTLTVDRHPYSSRGQTSQEVAEESLYLSAEIAIALQRLAQQHQVTMNTIVQGAWALLLAHYSGENDVLFGSIVSGRPAELAGVESMIGLFINTLPVRIRIDGGMSLMNWFRQIQEQQVEARQYEYTPLVDIQRWSDVPTDQPFFESLFLFQNYPVEPMEEEDLRQLTIQTDRVVEHTNYPLWLKVVARHALSMQLTYDRVRFDQVTAVRLLEHLRMLLEAIASPGVQRLADLPYVTDAERQLQLVTWNSARAEYADDCSVQRLFERQVDRVPDAVALAYDDEQVTYQQLNRRANILARWLVDQGVGLEIPVALLSDRTIAFVTAILAIMKAGGVYLPLDPLFPETRLRHMLSQSHCRVVLTTGMYLSTLSHVLEEYAGEERPSVMKLETVLAQGEQDGADNLPERTHERNLAYIIYTSGSTGTPKGVMVEHKGMLNHIFAKIADVQLSSMDSVAQNGPQCFDISVWQCLAPLILGGRVQVFKDEIAFSPQFLLEQIEEKGISVLQLVPSMLREMVQSVSAIARPALADLRWIVPTGDALPAELCRQWLELYPSIPLLNTYGSTECSDDQCHYPIISTQSAATWPVIMTIGSPIPNMRSYILDRLLELLPTGIVGELYIGGIGVGRGYLNDPERTALAFVPDPFSTEPGRRLYKTNDMAHYLPDGTIEFLGRADHLVKIKGYRIEPGEIEAMLEQHAQVSTTVVVAQPSSSGSQQLFAYVVANNQADAPSAQALRSYLQSRLPEYMIPSYFVMLEALPLTSNGKIDRRALPVPDQQEQKDNSVAPRTAAEVVVARIWQDVLNLSQVGVQDDFFALGGHSLLATQVISRLSSAFQVELPLRSLFDAPTVEGLVNEIALVRGGLDVVEEIAEVLNEIELLEEDELQQQILEAGEGMRNE
ncbi:non-ribosomal peptide synthetase [Ktedonobacteria bacterium brp13]|nr:non-ribosomal peptide synthetase [Ktedonobacteria bacterium brp13]